MASGTGFGLDAQLVHDGHVVGDVAGLVEVERAVELFEVDHVGQVRFGKPQNGERPAGSGMRADAERDDLERDVGQVGELEQVLQLDAHHLRACNGPTERRLVQYRPQFRGTGAGE